LCGITLRHTAGGFKFLRLSTKPFLSSFALSLRSEAYAKSLRSPSYRGPKNKGVTEVRDGMMGVIAGDM
jgi:hypothetical protein